MDAYDVDEVGKAAMVLTKVEMDIVCSSEKLCNLNVLMMNVATRESHLEASLSVKEDIPDKNVLEFNLLCGVLDAEVNELGIFFCSLEKEIGYVREVMLLSTGENMEGEVRVFEEKLKVCEDSLKQSREQLDEMKMQSADLQKSLSFFWNDQRSDYVKDTHVSGRSQHIKDKMHMQTGEQQRNVLRLLEKSLATELDLDKKLHEARQVEEELKLKLHTSQQETFYFEEEARNIWAQWLEADNVAVVLMGISKDLLGQLKTCHFNTEVIELKKNMEDCERKICVANSKTETAEAKCNILEESNSKLNAEKECMEEQMKELDVKLQHALASEEASQENQSMLNCMVGDMENLINDLKAKVLNAECRADGAEAKCHVLSESNADLNEEVSFLRNRLEVLEASAIESNEIKTESAKNIEMRTKVITSLVMQLATERDRLHEQLLSLVKENKALVFRLQMANKGQPGDVDPIKQDRVGRSQFAHESKFSSKDKDNGDETVKVASVRSEMSSETSTSPCKTEAQNSESISELETVRTIDAGVLNFKHLIVALAAVMMIYVAAYSFQNSNS